MGGRRGQQIQSSIHTAGTACTKPQNGGRHAFNQRRTGTNRQHDRPAVATNTEAAIKPLAEKVDALQANHQQLADTLTANSRAEEKAKREAVAAKHGDIVANALSGDALDAMFKTLGEAAPLGTNNAQQHKETGAPAADEHFK